MIFAIRWALGILMVLVISVPINGLLISTTWGWFIVPITGARTISVAEGVGLAMFCSIIGSVATAHLTKWDFDFDGESWGSVAGTMAGTMLIVGVAAPLFGLTWAWIWHTFFM